MILFLLLLTLAMFTGVRFFAERRHSALENWPLLSGAICALLAALLTVVYLKPRTAVEGSFRNRMDRC